MTIIALIKNAKVDNLIVSDIEHARQLIGYDDAVDVTELPAGTFGIGWGYAEGVFAEPSPVVVNYGTRVTRLAFRNRFTQSEKVALYTGAESSIAIKIYLDDLNAATFVDLARPDTIASIGALVTAGLLTVDRGAAILNAPVQPDEVPA